MMRHLVRAVGMRIPRPLRHFAQRFVDLGGYKRAYWAMKNPLAQVERGDDNAFGSPCRVGIIHNQWQSHTPFIAACQELGVPFQVLDLAGPDWIERVRESGCGLFLVWPDAISLPWSAMLKDRVQILEAVLGYPVTPSSHELWMYEDKRRMAYWLAAQGLPHPQTWVFYRPEDARRFIQDCPLPIVFKMPMGSSARGVAIVRNRRMLQRLVSRAFGKGHVPPGHDHRDAFRGSILFQEYLPDIREWRLVRIGDSYFGHPKGRVGDFHSGSGVAEWDVPEPRHLDFLHQVTECGRFVSMAVDTFETPDGRLLVNELQTVFGASTSIDQLKVDGVPGRMVREGEGTWRFEAGDFARNACANERIRNALSRVEVVSIKRI